MNSQLYFKNSLPNIYSNDKLRKPQKFGYFEVYDHFVVNDKKTHAIVVLPTGVGKTGLMAILPFHISSGKVLIIAPQIVIRDTVVDALNPENPRNFWLQQKVFDSINELPVLIEYQGKETKQEIMDQANIVVTNAQKLQKRLDSSPLHKLPSDYFDMIIIDEAHHSTATTWVDTIHHFSHAKIVKITATPFRTDREKIAGDLVYKYKLSQAMAKGYVKSLENVKYIPEKLFLTLDNNTDEKYTIDQIKEMNLRDDEWISRSVAYSDECKERVVQKSIELLEQKLTGTNVPHKIIAVAPTIAEAEKINEMYVYSGYQSVIIHNELDPEKREKAFNDIKNHRVKVVVNVSMLGEGYDHAYLSIAAIFRAFRSPLPYAQFIGRILRAIPENKVQKPSDNIGNIIAHKHLGLEELWEYYKKEIQESEVIKSLDEEDIDSRFEDESGNDIDKKRGKEDLSVGNVTEEGIARLTRDPYLETELLKKHRQIEEERIEKIRKLQETLHIDAVSAEKLLNTVQSEDSEFKRPDLLYRRKRSNIDTYIKEEMIPELMVKFKLSTKGTELLSSRLFSGKYRWISRRPNITNGAAIAIYISSYLNNHIGYKRDEWTTKDFDIAFDELEVIYEFIENTLENEFKK